MNQPSNQINVPLQYLINLGVFEVKHSGRTLGEHLVKTHDLLSMWGCPESWCLGGLYHSVYGNDVFQHKTTEDRDAVRNVIGLKAELLAWEFCSLPANRVQALVEAHVSNIPLLTIHAANQIEQGSNPQLKYYQDLLPPTLLDKIEQSYGQQYTNI